MMPPSTHPPADTTSQAQLLIPIDQLHPDPEQPRTQIDPEAQTALTANIAKVGVLQPIRVRPIPGGFQIIDGHCRHAAGLTLGLTHLPAVVDSGQLSEADVVYQQLSTTIRSDLNPLDRANAVYRLLAISGKPAAQLAPELETSGATITKLLKLRTLSKIDQERVRQGSLGLRAAYELAKREGSRAGPEQLTGGALARKIKRAQASDPARPAAPRRLTAALGHGCKLVISSSRVTLDSVIGQAEDFLRRAKDAHARGISLVAFVASLNPRTSS